MLAPELRVGSGLAGDVIGELCLALDGDGTAVDLMAAVVVEVLSLDELATLVSAGAVGGPLKNVHELLVGLW